MNQPQVRHLLCIDGTNLLRTCFEANPAPESSAKVDGVFKATLGSYKRAVRRHQPTHVAVAFDLPNTKNWRHGVYEGYKASRKPTPELLAERVPEFIESVRALGLLPILKEGFEAEDIINTICQAWLRATAEPATVSSTDKDLAQLVYQGVVVHGHFKDEWRGEDWIRETYGVEPTQFVDYLSLLGDASDDIPGVPKVGAKTAQKLLAEHGSLEALLDAAKAGSITGAVGKSLKENAESGLLSKKLVLLAEPELGIKMSSLAIDWTHF